MIHKLEKQNVNIVNKFWIEMLMLQGILLI